MRTLLWVIALSMPVGEGLTTQGGVDFSGRWILVAPSAATSDAPPVLSVRQSLVTTNVRGEPMPPFFKEITVEREVPGGTRAETYQIGVAGGSVRGIGGGTAAPPQEHFAVRWEGNVLVFERGSYTGRSPETGVWTERREVWSFDADGRLHVVIESRGSTGSDRDPRSRVPATVTPRRQTSQAVKRLRSLKRAVAAGLRGLRV